MKIILSILSGILFFGCLPTETETKYVDREVQVKVTDTLYRDPPVLGAPNIVTYKVENSKSVSGDYHNYIYIDWKKMENAIGYKVYYSLTKESGYSLVTTGTLDIEGFSGSAWRTGIYFSTITSSTIFFKVSSINSDGTEGPQSSAVSVFYDKF